jgi:alginate O-acetyltransferase complex protein AlgI
MLFKFEDLSSLGQAFINLFCRNGFTNTTTWLLFKNNLFFIIVACLAATPIIPVLSSLAAKNKLTAAAWRTAGAIVPTILVIISAICLAGNSYNPFLYFQF